MILFTQHIADGKRGGEKTTLKLFEYFRCNFNNVLPVKLVKLEKRLQNPIADMIENYKNVNKLNPNLLVVDVSSGIRNILAALIVKCRGNKLMTIMLGLRMAFRHDNFLTKFIIRMCERFLLNVADVVLVNSNYTAQYVRNKTNRNKKIIVARPGIDIDYRIGFPKSHRGIGKSVLFVGECTKVKGLYFLVEAIALLRDINLHLDIVGNYNTQDKYYLSIIKIIKKYDISADITFHSYVDVGSIVQYYNSADIFVVPSLFEGYGKILAEALVFGLPIVATTAGAIPEMVDNEVNALLVKPGDSKELAKAIRRLLSDKDLQESMRKANLTRAKKLNTWDDYFATLDKHLKPLVEEIL